MEFIFRENLYYILENLWIRFPKVRQVFLGNFYMHQENNVAFMTKNVNFTFFLSTLL